MDNRTMTDGQLIRLYDRAEEITGMFFPHPHWKKAELARKALAGAMPLERWYNAMRELALAGAEPTECLRGGGDA